ncbi:MAG TPA: NAD-dependent DNA ligase LigA, partial [Desulfobacterales bacterium]|nr:NAD-dependent DNA ligase LigA [Desulfobacterales bacterium]
DIDGLGKKVVDQLVNEGLIKSFADIFLLEKDTLADLDRMAQKSAANLVASVEKSKKVSLRRFLYALGIDHTGENAAKLISEKFSTLKDIMETSEDVLQQINGIGPETAQSVSDFFSNRENMAIIKDVINCGVEISNDQPVIAESNNNPFNNKRVVLTGTLQTMPRSKAKKQLEKLGAAISSSISSKTHFLIAGQKPGSKFVKAQKFGIEIMDETRLTALFNQYL